MKCRVIFLILINIMLSIIPTFASEGLFTAEENKYIEVNEDKVFTIGIHPMSRKDYFSYENKLYGYIFEVIDILEEELQLDFDLKIYSTWDSAYKSFMNEKVDLLFGANQTEKREAELLFTEPLDEVPYGVFIHKDSDLLTIGDFEDKIIGFQKSDMVIDVFKEKYKNLTYDEKEFTSEYEGFYNLSNRDIDGFITIGGIMAYKIIYDYEDLKLMTQLDRINSSMTLCSFKENEILMRIIMKTLEQPTSKERIEKSKAEVSLKFNQKVLQLSDVEKSYLKSNKKIRVGISNDYLPFEYYSEGSFLGVGGRIFTYISELINLDTEVVVDDFNSLYEKALTGDIDVLVIAKTKERENYFYYPRPFYNERDVIYGKSDSKSISSIYELENKTVAVIKGYWYEGYLRKNLSNPKIKTTKNIQESLDFLSKGEVDYVIENRLVGDYYINLYGYDQIQGKGVTTRTSALYFGVTKGNAPLASIIDKALKIVDYNKMEREGIQSIPYSDPIQVEKQRTLIVILVIALLALIYTLYRVFDSMVDQKSESRVLKEKQKLLYIDSLTGLRNRHYFDMRLKALKNVEDLCFIMIDINNLKKINDTYGHLIGDELIKLAAEKIEEIFKDFEHIRFGGDEFLLISKNKSEKEIQDLIKTSQEVAKGATFEFENITVSGFTFGIGYAIRKNSNEPINDVFTRADHSMYQNKIKVKKRNITQFKAKKKDE